MRHGSQFANGA